VAEAGRSRVLMIGLDAMEGSLVRRWMAEGALPHLAGLRDRGASGPLASSARWLIGSPWPTFYTGTPPEEHGFYHYLMWRPESMSTERASPAWLPLRPFWRRLGEAGRRAIAIDAPLVYPPEPFEGIEISGWGTRELLEDPAAHPPAVLEWVRSRFARPQVQDEATYPLAAAELLGVRDHWIDTTTRVADLGVALMQREAWDLFLVCFMGAHRCGHQLWHTIDPGADGATPELERAEGALKDVYVACDAAVGRLVEAAGPDAVSLAFAVHGMGPNLSRTDLLREMLARVLEDGEGGAPAGYARIAHRLRARVPLRWRSAVKTSLPQAIQDRLTLFWRSGGIDWRATRAFMVFGDQEGYLRFNLRGREAAGIVEPGPECEALRARIEEGLRSFVDEDTGEPLVSEIRRREDLFPEGARCSHLPDLVVYWSERPAAAHRRIVSPRHGGIAWPTPGRHPQGRSGNHRPDGFLIAAGGPVPAGEAIEGAHILDLAPTVYALLGRTAPPEMRGRALFQAQP